MKPPFGSPLPLSPTQFFRHRPDFYQHEVPDLYPLFSHEAPRVAAAAQWLASMAQNPSDLIVPPAVIGDSEFTDSWIGRQRHLERQRMELLLCESPGHILQYSEQLHTALSTNHLLLTDYARSTQPDKLFNCVIVSAEFYYSRLGREPNQWFAGTFEWWQLHEMLRAFHIEIPPEHENTVPRTGLLWGEDYWQVIANLVHGRVFFAFDGFDEAGSDSGSSGGAGGGGGANSGPGSGGDQGYLGGPPAPAPTPAPAGPSIGPDGAIVGETNPNVSPETEEESSWWSSLTSAVSNLSLSDIVHTTLDIVGLVPGLGEVADGINALIYLAEGNYADAALSAAAMIPGAGAAATAAKYAKKTGLGKAMLKGGKKLVSKVDNVAAKVKNGLPSPKIKETCTGGCPISLVTGEELLQFTDFELPGRLPFRFERTYRSGHDDDYGLGVGWTFSGCEHLINEDETLIYVTDEARRINFPQAAVGETVGQAAEQLFLTRTSDGQIDLEDGSGLTRSFTFQSGRWLLRHLRRADGAVLTFSHQNGNLQRIETSCGRALVLHWSAKRLIERLTFEEGGRQGQSHVVARYTYDEQRDLVANHDALDLGERYRYRNHVLVQRTLRTGFNYYFEWDRYDTNARCLHNWGDDGNYDVRFAWFPEQQRSEITDSRGFTTRYHYNEFGQIIAEVDPSGRETTFARNRRGEVTQMTRANGAVEAYAYDGFGRMISHTQCNGGETRYGYNERGDQTHVTDVQGRLWRRLYNEQRQVVETIDPNGSRSYVHYNEQGLPKQIQQADGAIIQLSWNQRGELVEERYPDGRTVSYAYDAFGRVVRTQHGKAVTQFRYDGIGRVVRITQPDNTRLKIGYNANNQISSILDQNNALTRYLYEDGLDQVTQRINPDGTVVQYRYDTERNLAALVNENGETHQFFYDGNERLIKEIGFDGRTQTYDYDPNGNMIRHQDGDVVTHFERDLSGRLLRRQSVDSVSGRQDVATFAYDVAGKLTRADNDFRKLRFFYDTLGRLVEEWQDDHVVTCTYDAVGNATGYTMPTGHQVRFDNTATGNRLATWLDGRLLARREMDEDGRERFRAWGNHLEEHRSYDPVGRLRDMRLSNRQSRADIAARTYHHDAGGAITHIQDLLRGVSAFGYDACRRLAVSQGVVSEQFTYDPAGNPVPAGAEAVVGNRLAQLGERRFTYDARGNQTAVAGPGAHDSLQFEYSPGNQLRRATRDGLATEYEYDALGRRVRKRKGGVVTEFLWLRDTVITEWREEHGRPAPPVLYVYEEDGLTPLAMVVEDKRYFYHNDHLGTPQELTDENGTCVWAARYRAFGRIQEMLVDEIHQPLRFLGQYHDDETGLHYNRHRYYDPDQGRFIHQDPIGLLGGLNAYNYAPNPVNWCDPLGLMCKEADGDFVYRLLRPDEDIAKGIVAKRPGFAYPQGVNTHVLHGSRDWFKGDKWISTARDPKALQEWAQPGQTLVRIDLNKTKDSVADVIDLSVEANRNKYLKGRSIGYAKASTEVLVEGKIDPKAIEVVTFSQLGL